MAGGDRHSVALKADGGVWAWGSNSHGQLGDGTTTNRLIPVQVRGPGGPGYLTGVTDIAAGRQHSLALRDNGTAWSWGANFDGQLGDATTLQRTTPVRVLGLGHYPALHHGAPSTPWTRHDAGVNAVFGHSLLQQTNMSIPGRGVPLNLTRSYSSADPSDIGFGVGWSFSFGLSITAQSPTKVLVRNADGRRDRYTSADGVTFTPPAGIYHTLTKSAADGSYTLTTPDQLVHQFDLTGRLTSIADRNNNTTRLSYTATNLTITDPGGRTLVLTYGTGFDSKRFVSLTDTSLTPNRTVGYSYDTAGDLRTVTDVRGNFIRMTYDGSHRLRTLVNQNGHTVVEHLYPPETDPHAGKVKEQKDANTVANCAVIDTRQNLLFDYSTPGQTKVTDRRGFPTTYTYDGAKRLTSVGSGGGRKTYGYDAAGNQTSRDRETRGSDTFEYDATGRLSKAIVESGTATYGYDGDGLRVTRTASGLTRRLTWDVSRALPVVLDDGQYLYLYGAGDAPLARHPKGGPASGAEYYHADGLGSTRAATGAGGTALAFCDYDAWGAAYNLGTSCPQEVAYAGQQRDGETDYYYLRARHYDPKLGRFVQPDPVGYGGGDNLYAYAGNNPTTYTEPAGLEPKNPLTEVAGVPTGAGPLSGQRILFGQARIGPNFSRQGIFNGRSINEVAEVLRAGRPGSLQSRE